MAPVLPIKSITLTPEPAKIPNRIAIKQVDAFTDAPLSGNPAGVVLNAEGLTDGQMRTIAREMSLSETAFVLPASTEAADLRIRWFTPESEVPLCGHATIATFHALAEESMYGMLTPGLYYFKLETKSGILPVTVDKRDTGSKVMFGLVLPQFVRAGQYKLDMLRILNITLDEFENRLPIVTAGYLYVPIRRLHTLFSMKPNFFAMSQFLTNRNLSGLCVFTTETVDRSSAVHSRFFAPTLGVNEDPVTGSANGPLGAYLYEHKRVEPLGDTVTMVGEQGDVIGRKGRVLIQLKICDRGITSLEIGGSAVTVLTSEMLIS